MGGRARRGLAVASATWVLAGAGCRDEHEPSPSAATEGEASSSGTELDASSTTAEPVPGACTPGESRACYEGPPGTEGLGACAAGQQVCAADGRGFTECTGQVWPEPAERCDTPQDDDCDGLTLCEPTLEWSQTFPALVTHVAARGQDGAVVVGADAYDDFQGESLEGMFVAALDASGGLVWARSTGFRSYTWPNVVAVDGSGAIVVAGWYDGAPDLGGGPLRPSIGFGGFAARYEPDGSHVWSHALATEGYDAIAFGPDGVTYLAGGYVYDDSIPGLESAQVHVLALDAEGGVAWALPGQGSWYSESLSLLPTAAGELALVAVAGGANLTLGALQISDSDTYEPIVVRIGPDGTPLRERRLIEPPPPTTFDMRAFARPGGALAAGTVTLPLDEGHANGVLVVALDEALEPVSQTFLGNGTWGRSIAPHPDGTTLMTLDFSGLLELGPIGVGVNGPAVAVIDDEGQGRWAEVLHAEQSEDLVGAAATPEGSVLVAGYVGERGGVLAGGAVYGPFVAKLRP